MMWPGRGGEHRLAVNGHLGVLDDDVRPPSSVQNHPPTVGIEYVRKGAHAIGLLMLLANSGTRGGAYSPAFHAHQGDTRRQKTIGPPPKLVPASDSAVRVVSTASPPSLATSASRTLLVDAYGGPVAASLQVR